MVGIPSFDRSLKGACAESVGNAIDHAESDGLLDRVVHRYPKGYGIARARNFMAQWALDEGVDYLLMVDSDIILPSYAISSLIGRDVDVCLGWYVRGETETETNMVRFGSSDNSNCHKAFELAKSDELIQVRRGGMGCALIRTGVFRRFKRPWFVYHDFPDGSGLSEDYDFCKKCWQAGIPVHVDARVGCGHIHDRVLEAR